MTRRVLSALALAPLALRVLVTVVVVVVVGANLLVLLGVDLPWPDDAHVHFGRSAHRFHHDAHGASGWDGMP